MQPMGSVDSVIAALRDDAAAELEQIRARADADIADVRKTPIERGAGDRSAQIAAATKRVEELLAREEWEERRQLMEARETWIRGVVARASQILSSIDDARRAAIIARFTDEARRALPSGEVDIAIAKTGGCIVRCGDIVFDNSFEQRARRLEPVWRRKLAEMYRV